MLRSHARRLRTCGRELCVGELRRWTFGHHACRIGTHVAALCIGVTFACADAFDHLGSGCPVRVHVRGAAHQRVAFVPSGNMHAVLVCMLMAPHRRFLCTLGQYAYYIGVHARGVAH